MITNEPDRPSTLESHAKRVLCYAPYNMWALHGMWEMTILHSLRLRGAEVRYVLCDGLYSDCDVFWSATNPRHAMSCTNCQASVANLANRMGMPFVWLGRYLFPNDFCEAGEWVERLATDDFFTATYQDCNIGEWVAPSVYSHLRISELDLGLPQKRDVYRSYLYSGIIACLGINRLFDEYKPDVLFLFNGRLSSTRVALEMARKRGIKVICHERGTLKESLKLTENVPGISMQPVEQAWRLWKDIPLISKELENISQYMDDRQQGKNLNWRSYSPAPQDINNVRRNLGLISERPLFVLFNSSDDEIIGHKEWQGPFSTQMDWIKRTVSFAERHPEFDLVIRVHPNIAGKKATGNNVFQLRQFEDLQHHIPRNVRLVMPEDPISSYSLMDITNHGLVYMSTVGLEMACKGKKVLVAGGGWLHGKPFVDTVLSADAYEETLEAFLQDPEQDKSLDIMRMAYRYVHSVFFRLSIPFPLVKMPDPHTGYLAYNSFEALLPGKEPNLDRITRIILEDEPLILPPTQAEKARPVTDEDQWLKNHMFKKERFETRGGSKPKVSVIIPCYNYGKYLEPCIQSVIAQTYQDFEIIIVNDGSTDNTKEVAAKIITAHPHYRIKVIHQANSGQPAISRNRAISEAKGEYILPLDADDMIAPSMLEECTRILDQNRSVAIAYTDRLDFDGVDQVVYARDYDYSRLKYENHISYSALFRKEVWEAVGGFRTNVKGCEDWDFWVAAGAKGYFGRRIPKPLFMYRRHDTGVYQEVVNRLAEKHAQIVINHSGVYSQKDIAIAERILGKKIEPGPKAEPIVSVIVPTCNRPEMLAETLKSILQQTYQNIEILVVNDGETDVQNIVASLNKKGNITYVKHSQNKGLAAARNSGIKLARGKYIAYLDDDDLFYPRHVETLVAFLESSEYKVAYTDAYRAHQEKKNSEYVVIKRDVPYSFDFDYDRILETNFVPVLCCMHERSCVEEVGLFDESLKKLEDWDLWVRMSRKFKFAHIKQLTCEFTWRTDGTTMTSGQGHEFIEARNMISRKYNGAHPVCLPRPKFPGKAEKSLVSVVILTFNQLKYTRECVASIRKNTPEPHEIIFVDNGSTGGTVKWLNKLVKEHRHYKLIRNEKNLGFAKGCNQGIESASGEYVLLLNNDVIVTPNWLSDLQDCLKSSKDIGIVGPMTNHISGPQQVPKVGYFSIADLDEYARSFREKNRYRRIPFRRIVGFCMLFRRELVEQVGLLDESFGTGNFEDDDFSLRAEMAGYRNVIAGDVFIHHFGSRSFIGNKIDYRKTMKGNCNYFLEKWNSLDPQSAEGKKYLSLRGREAAKLDYEKGQAKKAVDRLLAVIRLGIEAQENYYELAGLLLDAKQYDQAFRVLEQMPDADHDERKYALLGYCQEGFANPLEAQKLAEQALSLNPSNPFALNLKGILSYRKGDKEEAQDYFQRAAAGDPGFGEPHTNLGVIRWEDNRQKEALQLFERGFILSPTITDILHLYHAAVTQTGEFARAEQNFYEAKALHPFHQGLRFFLIDILLKQEKYKAAMEEIEQAMGDFGIEDEMLKAALEVRKRIGPQEKSSQDQGGRISLCMIVKDEENDLLKCLRSVKPVVDEIIVVDTGSADRTRDIATVLGAKVFEFPWENDFSAARNFSISQARGDWILILDADEVISPLDHASLLGLTKAGSLRAGYSLVTRNYLNTLGVTQWTANDGTYDEEAGNGWIPSEKVRLFPRDGRIHFENPVHEFVEISLERNRIQIHKCNIPVHHYGKLNEKKEKRKGEDYFLLGKKKLEKSSADLQSLRELAVQANILKRHEEAAELWHQVIRLQPNLQEPYVNLTSIYMNLGKFQEASATSQKAIELDPECKEAVLNYSIVEFALGNLKKVITALENLLSKIPEYPLAMGLLSVAYRLDGEREKSQSLIVRIKKAGFNYDEYLENTAKHLIALGRSAEAGLLAEMMEGKEPRARFQGASVS